ncbi:hypothetical protein [Streptomyces sp. NBC_01264]|uniref:hypothetical protein n=1 Tax=Streptomyces sp. NBC_01264 TaxID=2903804 RepID=UPI00224F246A|nr:hypothetical protein [Streptomyces sp. NBC_01264]MCX4777251.1 hypothetical protein [Streptomyces sp. NBC_01264]
MLQVVLAATVFAAALAVYGTIGLRWRRRVRLWRAFLGRVAALEFEPYHAAALKNEESGAAAAELLRGGRLDIDADGAVLLTETGRGPGPIPAHPVPAGLLEALRRHDPEPVSIGWIERHDAEYATVRFAHREEREALLPVRPRPPVVTEGSLRACCGCVGVVLLVVCWIAAAELLVVSRPHGVLEWAASGVTALCLGLLWYADGFAKAVRARTESGDPLWDRIHGERHPAVEGLDERQRLHLLRSLDDCGRWRGTDRVERDDGADHDDGADDDADEDDSWWDEARWADAYHYRASDAEQSGPGTRDPS